MKYMPTVKCPQCGMEFSAMLAECPHCGKRRTRETDKDFTIQPDVESKPTQKTEEVRPAEKPKTKPPAWQSLLGVALIVLGLVAAGLACFTLGREIEGFRPWRGSLEGCEIPHALLRGNDDGTQTLALFPPAEGPVPLAEYVPQMREGEVVGQPCLLLEWPRPIES